MFTKLHNFILVCIFSLCSTQFQNQRRMNNYHPSAAFTTSWTTDATQWNGPTATWNEPAPIQWNAPVSNAAATQWNAPATQWNAPATQWNTPAKYPAGVNPMSCPNYPYCNLMGIGYYSAPQVEPLPGWTERQYPAGVSSQDCPNFPFC